MSQIRYKYNWFGVSEIKDKILTILSGSDKNTILEIGSFEGVSSVFFAENLLNHSESTLTCVDPFLTIDNNDHIDLLENVEKNFDYNTSICKNSSKIIVKKTTSDNFFQTNTRNFNFIYIDGSHECDIIRRDMENAFNVLESGGIMWMDDYRGGSNDNIKNTIDGVLSKWLDKMHIFHIGYQIAIRKFSI